MNSTWIRIGCACLGAIALAGCQQDRDAADADVTIAGERVESIEERMRPRAQRVASAQFSDAGGDDVDSAVSSSGETYYASNVGDERVIFNTDGVAVTEPLPAASSGMSSGEPSNRPSGRSSGTSDDVDVDVKVRPNQQME